MTGWSAQEAYGRPPQEVLKIIDGDSRAPAMNPLSKTRRLPFMTRADM